MPSQPPHLPWVRPVTTLARIIPDVGVNTNRLTPGMKGMMRVHSDQPRAEIPRTTSPPYLSLDQPPNTWVAAYPQRKDDITAPYRNVYIFCLINYLIIYFYIILSYLLPCGVISYVYKIQYSLKSIESYLDKRGGVNREINIIWTINQKGGGDYWIQTVCPCHFKGLQ